MLDFRYATRKLRQAPGFAAVAALSLAIGIGATVTMYAVIDAADFRGLPYPRADRLVVDEQTVGGAEWDQAGDSLTSAPVATTGMWLRSAHSFTAMSRVGRAPLTWPHDDETELLEMSTVGPDFFAMLGATPMIGRAVASSDTTAGAPGGRAEI